MPGSVEIKSLAGAAGRPFIPALAQLRIQVFREFPYLYEGTLDYEETYLRAYTESDDCNIVIALDGNQCVGASTALPLEYQSDALKRPFLERGHKPRDIFYLGESVLLQAYRGRGIGVRFFEEREKHAQSTGDFSYAAFCAVERSGDHPLRPPDYRDLTQFWKNRGYVKQPSMRTTFNWRDVGEHESRPKPMVFWTKALRQRD